MRVKCSIEPDIVNYLRTVSKNKYLNKLLIKEKKDKGRISRNTDQTKCLKIQFNTKPEQILQQ